MVTEMFCMRCGQEMPDSLNYCTNCGNDLSSSRAAVSANAAGRAGATATQGMVQPAPAATQPSAHLRPGKEQAPGQSQAYRQVHPVDPAMAAGRTAVPQAATQKNNKTVPIIIAVAVIAALVLAAVAYFVVGGTKDTTTTASSATSSTNVDTAADGESSQATKQPDGEAGNGAQDDVPVANGAPRFSTLSASSVLAGDIDSHEPDCLVDGNTTTAWCEGVSGTGEGEWVEFNSDMKQNVHSIRIMAGFNKSEDLYWKNSRPKDITITFDDGTTTTSTLSDEPFAWHTITLSETVQTSSLRITIDSTYPGSRYTDTCISEITIQ